MKFSPIRMILIFPVFFSINLLAQQLSIEDIINMRKMPVEQIDSIVKAKDFVKTKSDLDTVSSIVKYASLYRTDTALIQRTLTVGVKADKNVELQYAVYQQKDALAMFDWLEKNGFKKTVTVMPNKDGKKMFEYISFKKKKQSVGYEEIEYNSVDKKEKVFIFSVNTFDFP